MKSNRKQFELSLKFLIIGLLLFFSLSSVAQRNITTIRIEGETLKKKAIVDSLAEWMSRSDLRKADSCIQVIFNARHRKDTSAEISGIKGFQTLVNSEKYAGFFLPIDLTKLICSVCPQCKGCTITKLPDIFKNTVQ